MMRRNLGIVYISQWKTLSQKQSLLCKCAAGFNGSFAAK